MIDSRRMLNEVIASLRTVIAPAIAEPYPKTQAYMAAVILEMVARQVEERADTTMAARDAIAELFSSIRRVSSTSAGLLENLDANEAGLGQLIERLHADRATLGEEGFSILNQQIRDALRRILNQELKIAAGKAEA